MAELSRSERIENDTPNEGTSKQILIAEDEPGVRSLLQLLLKRWGYRTLVAQNGKEALNVAADHPGDIDLLLSDVTMPEMDGPELAEKLTKKRPAIKVILMSGFSHMHVVVQRGWRFVQKPFKPADIKETIEEVL
jgi:two-component system, cell cycle sensor histidine kinase and response regulator CckA